MNEVFDKKFEKYLAETEGQFLVQVFFRGLFLLGLAIGVVGAVLAVINFVQLARIGQNIFLTLLIAATLFLLFGRLGQWVNDMLKIQVCWNDQSLCCQEKGERT